MRSDLLGRYILSLYNYGLAIVGILAAIILMAGGLLWLTSGGSAAKIGQAKELMTGSIIGLIILVGAWMILNTINPNLTRLPSIDTLIVTEVPYCCDSVKGNILAVKGECPGSSKGCTNGETCTNQGTVDDTGSYGTNNFSCINSGGSICCEHVANDGKTRICMSFPGTSCPPMPASWKYSTDYKLTAGNYFKNLYCGYERIIPYSDNCKDSLADCSNIKDGQKCPGDRVGYCYNKICWFGIHGNDGEPCGTLSYSKCDKDLEQNGKHCNGDQGWINEGRSCDHAGSGVTCCKFNADETRVNK
jgi:hypothetical protein